MLEGTLPCYIEYLNFIYNISNNIKEKLDDYKNLIRCLEILKQDKLKTMNDKGIIIYLSKYITKKI